MRICVRTHNPHHMDYIIFAEEKASKFSHNFQNSITPTRVRRAILTDEKQEKDRKTLTNFRLKLGKNS